MIVRYALLESSAVLVHRNANLVSQDYICLTMQLLLTLTLLLGIVQCVRPESLTLALLVLGATHVWLESTYKMGGCEESSTLRKTIAGRVLLVDGQRKLIIVAINAMLANT